MFLRKMEKLNKTCHHLTLNWDLIIDTVKSFKWTNTISVLHSNLITGRANAFPGISASPFNTNVLFSTSVGPGDSPHPTTPSFPAFGQTLGRPNPLLARRETRACQNTLESQDLAAPLAGMCQSSPTSPSLPMIQNDSIMKAVRWREWVIVMCYSYPLC